MRLYKDKRDYRTLQSKSGLSGPRPKPSLVIDEFKELGSGIWRLVWYGVIARNHQGQTEPTFQAIFYRIKDGWNGDYSTMSALDLRYAGHRAFEASIGVGQLPGICIGTLWQDGQQISKSVHHKKTFKLQINTSTVRLAHPEDEINGEKLIPSHDYRVSGYGLNSWCLHIAHNGDPAGIIIPAMEAIRFYYAHSTVLSNAIFNGDFINAPESLVVWDESGMRGKCCVITRRRHVYDSDCWTIGRIFRDTQAKKGAKVILDSAIARHSNRRRVHPKTLFPFEGETTLTAKCVQVGKKYKRWLLLTLETCSGPFPYEQLEIHDPAAKADPITDLPEREKKPFIWPEKKTEKPDNEEYIVQSGIEPTAKAIPVVFELQQQCFLAIKGKEPIKPKKEKNTHKASKEPRLVSFKTDRFSTGDGTYGPSKVGPLRIKGGKENEHLPVTFEAFKKMVDILNTYDGVRAKLHRFTWGEGLISVTPAKLSRLLKWSFINHEEKRLRQLMIADIYFNNWSYCLIEVERKPQKGSTSKGEAYLAEIIYRHDRLPIDSEDIVQLKDKLSHPNVLGRMCHFKFEKLLPALRRLGIGIKHTWKTPGDYAKRVFRVIEQHQKDEGK